MKLVTADTPSLDKISQYSTYGRISTKAQAGRGTRRFKATKNRQAVAKANRRAGQGKHKTQRHK